MIKVISPTLALLSVAKKRKTSEIASRYAQSAAEIDREICELQEPREGEHYQYGRTAANKLRCMTPYQAA